MGQKHGHEVVNSNEQYHEDVLQAVSFATNKGTEDLVTKVDISVSCAGVKKPMRTKVNVWTQIGNQSEWVYMGTTDDSSNIGDRVTYARTILVDFAFEAPTRLKFEVISIGGLTGHDEKLLALNGGTSLLPLFQAEYGHDGDEDGGTGRPCAFIDHLEIFAEEATRSMDSLKFSVDMSELAYFKTRHSNNHKYYITISRAKTGSVTPLLFWDSDSATAATTAEKWINDVSVLIYRSERKFGLSKSDSAPVAWNDIDIRIDRICKGDAWRPVILGLWKEVEKSSSGGLKNNIVDSANKVTSGIVGVATSHLVGGPLKSSSGPTLLPPSDRLIGVSVFTYFDLVNSSASAVNYSFGKSVSLKLLDVRGDKKLLKSYSSLDPSVVGENGGVDGRPSNSFLGTFHVVATEVVHEYSFLDYVTAGLEISVLAAIDFTRSNGDPKHASSYHSIDVSSGEPGPNNEYVRVLESVLTVLEQYDSDKKIPVYGFGAKLPPSCTTVSHCFALNGDFFSPEVRGVAGVIEAYRNALGVVTLHGPTRFSEILKLAKIFAQTTKTNPKYSILLIITDGEIEDVRETVDEIVELSNMPISIVIVGVGESQKFKSMERLDADIEPLVSSKTGATMERDIVQFVPYPEFKFKPLHDLAMATLDEIPREVLKYFKMLGVFPVPNGDVSSQRKYRGFSTEEGGLDGQPKFALLTKNSQLSSNSSAAESNSLFSEYLGEQKEKLIETVARQGYPEPLVREVVETYGVLSPSPMHVIDVMFHLHKENVTVPPTNKRSENGVISIADRMCVKNTLAGDYSTNRVQKRKSIMRLSGKSVAQLSNLCGVCYTRAVDIRLQPCGHEVVCAECWDKLTKVCPLCRDVVDGVEYIDDR